MSAQLLTDAEVEGLIKNFPLFASENLVIRTKSGEKQLLEMNQAQEYIHNQLEDQLSKTGKVRVLILKGRQQGCSTLIQGRLYWRVSTTTGKKAFILTHEQEATDNLFGMTQRYHDNSLDDLKPETGASNAKELYFSGLDSGYKVGTAGTKGVGRSSTIQYFHGSEVAFWPHAETHLAGVLQAIPNEPGTEVILESTANGVGGVFYELWKEAEEGEGQYQAIFVPWYWQSEYSITTNGFEPTQDEKALAKLHGLTDGQLAWRREKIRELKSKELFKQEYPCTPEEAFIHSGRSAFEAEWLDLVDQECFSPDYRADIEVSTGKLSKRPDGLLRVWDDPKPGCRYVIGADVAEGLEHGDYSCADVLLVPGGEQVAQWHGHVDPDQFGQILSWLGKRYNKALIGVERNNHGLLTLTTLRNTKYSNVYAQQDIERRSEGSETRKFGWLTTSKSKFKIIDQLAAELRDEESGVVCKETVSEFRTYAIDESGSYNALHGCYDDRVMARAIAGEMLRAVPRGKK